ncbi:MAG: hypothetical protein HQK60_05215 [Deltaproteobacteria bacterium]|nr:hypothetical protein [Deltaproteobacteria bacterium]
MLQNEEGQSSIPESVKEEKCGTMNIYGPSQEEYDKKSVELGVTQIAL